MNNKFKVLIIEDEINICNFVKTVLEANDYQVVFAQSAIAGKTMFLSHRPELFDVYVEEEVDLVLTGHAHGGQFRLPVIGGLVAPNQGLFPKYDSGMFVEDDTHMIVSRGIGNSIIPLRINNPPEIVVVKLTAK